jgi:Organic solute transporter Ostalpha
MLHTLPSPSVHTTSSQNQGTPLILIRDAYESIVLTAFLYLLLTYLSPDPDEQKAIFLDVGLSRRRDDDDRRQSKHRRRDLSPELLPDPDRQARESRVAVNYEAGRGGGQKKNKPSPPTRWIFPLGWVRWKPVDGLHFFWMMKWGVLQYCIVRPTCVFLFSSLVVVALF